MTITKRKSSFKGVQVNRDLSMKGLHKEMQARRNAGEDVTLKGYISEVWGKDMTPDKFYMDLGIDMKNQSIEKMINTSELTAYLFPEIFRDAVRVGLEYSAFWPQLVTGDEPIESNGLTMPSMDFTNVDPDDVRLRDTNEGATITEGEIITWSEKQVTVKKKARGLKMTYESIMWTPINLAAIYFEEVGTRLASDLDAELVDIAFNGDQDDGSQSAPVIGAAVAGTLAYGDISRAWMRFKRIGRNSTVMLAGEADALTIIGMPEFQRTQIPNGVTPSGVTLNITRPLPTSQDILVHGAVPTGKILFIDTARAFVKLTAMPLLVESEKLVSRQIQGEYVSLITGFANIFRDGRLVLDYTTNLVTNPGPTPVA